MEKPPLPSIYKLFDFQQPIAVVDIGANPIGADPAYKPLLVDGHARVVGFEPNGEALATLNDAKSPNETYLPHAVGDGAEHTLKLCANSGMSSLLEPNLPFLSLFRHFARWGEVVDRVPVSTVRLDDVPETANCDYIKLDIQGGELMVLEHARARLAEAVVVHCETIMVPMYQEQPMFSEIELCLRANGYMLHRMEPIVRRTIEPVDPYAGMNQTMWTDAIFMRDLTKLDVLSNDKLRQFAVIMHDCYQSYDVTHYLLAQIDARMGTQMAAPYLEMLHTMSTKLAFGQQKRQIA